MVDQRIPSNLEAERCVLGSVLLDNDAYDRVSGVVRMEDFHEPKHAVIWQTIGRLQRWGTVSDPVTLQSYLSVAKGFEEVDVRTMIIGLMEHVPSSVHAEDYGRIVRDKADRRRLIETLHEAQHKPFDLANPDTTSTVVEDILQHEQTVYSPEDGQTFEDKLKDAVFDYDKPSLRLKWGSSGLDAKMNGTEPGSITILAARPGKGKTTYAIYLAKEFAKESGEVDIVSLEMSDRQIMPAMICGEAKIPQDHWTKREMNEGDFRRMCRIMPDLQKLPITIYTPDRLTDKGLRSYMARRAAKGVKLMIIDYLQLIHCNEKHDRARQVSDLSRMIKSTAMRLQKRGYNFRILALSQMNREIEKNKNRKPQMSDLRESGTLEQDADNIIFLHDSSSEQDQKVADIEVIIAKQREGGTGLANYRWDKACRHYTDMLGRAPLPSPRF